MVTARAYMHVMDNSNYRLVTPNQTNKNKNIIKKWLGRKLLHGL